MMGKQSGQIQMVILDIDSMIPEDHLLRQIKNCVNFHFIYEKAAPYYSPVGRKSIDPVVLIKMLLIVIFIGLNQSGDLKRKYLLTLLTAGFVELILCIEYQITQLLAGIEKDVFRRPAYSGKFLIRSY